MNPAESAAYNSYHPRIQRWIYTHGWSRLRLIQQLAAAPVLSRAGDVIVAAATASGKTEAVFFPVLSSLLTDRPDQGGVEVLYLAPLKALINDQYDRLRELCQDTDIPVNRWHGDVATSAKHAVVRRPEGLLLITPESLEALFVTRGSQVNRILRGLRYVVIDELHSFIGTERGAQLQSLLHRTEQETGRPVPRIALSATLGDFAAATRFLRPPDGHDVTVVRSDERGNEVRLQLRGYVDHPPPPATSDADTSEPTEESSTNAQAAIADHLFTVLTGRDNLVFANSRSAVEILTDRLADKCRERGMSVEFLVHHGSLSKELREHAEARLKDPATPTTAVCTSTLEMGIDIGSVDCIAQVGPPPAVAALRQRLGRAGRRGEPGALRLYVDERAIDTRTPPGDRLRTRTVQIIAMVDLLLEGWYEPPDTRSLHLSTLIQQILSLIAQRSGATAALLYRSLCDTGPFHRIGPSRFAELLRDLGAAKLIEQDRTGLLLLGPVGEQLVAHYSFYAAFATGEEYRLITAGRTLGTMPIINTVTVGSLLIFAGRRWQVRAVDEPARVIELDRAPTGRPPIWDSGSAQVHDVVRRRMRSIYLDTQVPAYLDRCAADLLAEGRTEFTRLGLTDKRILDWGKESILLPWRGDLILNTLAVILAACGLPSGIDGATLTIQAPADQLATVLAEVAAEDPPAPDDLAKAAANITVDKYDHHLGDPLRRTAYAVRSFDIPTTWALLQNLVREQP